MATVYCLDEESDYGGGWYQPFYHEDGHDYEADERDAQGVKAQLGLEYDNRKHLFYDPDVCEDFDDEEKKLSEEDLWEIEGDKRYHERVDMMMCGEL